MQCATWQQLLQEQEHRKAGNDNADISLSDPSTRISDQEELQLALEDQEDHEEPEESTTQGFQQNKESRERVQVHEFAPIPQGSAMKYARPYGSARRSPAVDINVESTRKLMPVCEFDVTSEGKIFWRPLGSRDWKSADLGSEDDGFEDDSEGETSSDFSGDEEARQMRALLWTDSDSDDDDEQAEELRAHLFGLNDSDVSTH